LQQKTARELFRGKRGDQEKVNWEGKEYQKNKEEEYQNPVGGVSRWEVT